MNLYFDYEWDHKMSDLEFEIKKAEMQLKSVVKRLQSMKSDILTYILFIIVPAIAIMILSIIGEIVIVLSLVTLVISSIITMVYVVMLPLCIYCLVKSIVIYILNNEEKALEQSDHPAQKDPPLRTYHSTPSERETSYQLEKEKLVWILHKYYIYKEKLIWLKSQNENGELTLSADELQKEFENMPLYAEITPANPFTGVMVKKARFITIILGVLLLICYFIFKNM